MEIDPRHLRTLLSIAEHGSFTRAAAARRMSQPAMSSGIMALKSLVMHAACVSILPRHAIALEVQAGVLRRIRLRDAASTRQIGTMMLRTRAHSPLADRFLAALRRVASGMRGRP